MKLSKTLGVATATALVATLAVAMEDNESAPNAGPITGTVAGSIKFEGDLPKITPINISAEQAKGCCAEGESVDDTNRTLIIDAKSKGLANVVVAIQVPEREVKLPEDPYVVDQSKCRFSPHMTIVPVGATVAFANSDSVSHNIHTYPVKNEGINVTVGAGLKTIQKLTIAEPVKVACDIHPWMGGYVYVTKGTDWAITAADGSFSIPNIPPGEYKLEIWHETLGKGKGSAVVKADGSCEVVEVAMSKKKRRRGR